MPSWPPDELRLIGPRKSGKLTLNCSRSNVKGEDHLSSAAAVHLDLCCMLWSTSVTSSHFTFHFGDFHFFWKYELIGTVSDQYILIYTCLRSDTVNTSALFIVISSSSLKKQRVTRLKTNQHKIEKL